MVDAWENFLRATKSEELQQSGFTWRRIQQTFQHMAPEDIVEEINAGSKDKQWGKYCFAILDVMTTNALPSDDVLYVPRCRRVDDLPFSSVSDHYPISIVWTRKKEKRLKRKGASAEPLVKRPLPEWLFKDDLFSKGLDERVEKWLPVRAHGNDGLVEYAQLVYDFAQEFLHQQHVEAVHPEHRLEIVTAMLQHCHENIEDPDTKTIPVDMRCMEKWLTRYPALQSKLVFEVNMDTPSAVSIAAAGLTELRQHAEQLTRELLHNQVSEEEGGILTNPLSEEPLDSFRAHHSAEHNLTKLRN